MLNQCCCQSALHLVLAITHLSCEHDGDEDGEPGGVFEIQVRIAPFGDTDLDLDVDFADFLILSRNYGLETYTKPDGPAIWLHGDFDGDGFVGFTDFLLQSRNYGA